MSGFLSGYKPQNKKVQRPFGNLKLRKKLAINECTDNPPLRKSSYLTDDDSGKEDEKLKTDSSQNTTNPNINITENDKNDENVQEDKENCGIADTVMDTVCTRLSEIKVVKQTVSESLFGSSLSETVPNTKSDSPVLREIEVPLSSKKQLFSPKKKDSFSSDEENVQQEPEAMDESEEVINILDSEEEDSFNIVQPPVLKVADSFVNCSSNTSSVNNFFNHIPSLPSNAAVTHSMIQKFKNGELIAKEEYDEVIEKSIPMETSDEEEEMHVTFRKSRKTKSEIIQNDSDNEHVEIGPTDESDMENDNDIVDLTHDESGPKSKAQQNDKELPQQPKSNPISVNISTQTPTGTTKKNINKKKNEGVTNINIKFNLKISIQEGSASSSESNEESSESSSESSMKKSHMKALAQSPFFERKSEKTSLTMDSDCTTAKNVEIREEVMNKTIEDNFHTPTLKKDEQLVIDEELCLMLDELYGETWKTPQILSSYKIKKFREDLRKSLAANNFESFVGSLSKDLESTRISSPKTVKPKRKEPIENVFVKPSSSSTKKNDKNILKKSVSNKNLHTTPELPIIKITKDKNDNGKGSVKRVESGTKSTPAIKNNKNSAFKNVPKTPLHLICDPDTSSESENLSDEDDGDFNPDDTWNASSDEDYQSEKDRIKKRQSIKQSDLIFTLDDSLDDDSINEILKKYEFKPKPQIETNHVEKPTRRKLFTHTHFDDDEQVPEVPKKQVDKTPLKSQNLLNVPKAATPRELKKTPSFDSKIPKVTGKGPSSITKPLGSSTKTTLSSCTIKNTTSKDLLKRFSNYSFLKSLDAESNKTLCDPNALYYRENYKSKKNELTEKLFKLYDEKVFDLQLKNVPFKWNKKLLTTGGRCNNSRRNGVRNSLIELSDKVLTSADRLRCTLIHEMCHAASWILNGENGHGSTWKKWTAKANAVFPELPKITVCHNYVIEYRFTYLCMTCHARSQTHTKNKKVEEIRCSLCKGSIQLFENKKNTEGKLELVPVQKKEPTAFAKYVKLKFKEVKQPHLSHKEVMQIISSQFSTLSVAEKAQL